jgi:hypothetical protein
LTQREAAFDDRADDDHYRQGVEEPDGVVAGVG